jgi:hypothetical protein
MLTRLEEVDHVGGDEHGRFTAAESHAYRHRYLDRPVVDEWLDVLGQVLRRAWPSVALKSHVFSAKVSHDVDMPSRYGFRPWRALPRCVAIDLLKYKDLRCLWAPWIRLTTHRALHPKDPFNTFDWLMDLSEAHGLVSAFYFICDRRGIPHDCDYALEYPAIRKLIRHIHERGHEIGLHPSYDTFLDAAQIGREANRLRRICTEENVVQPRWGGRMHYLQWRQPITLRAWGAAGMAYDSTLTYADHAGFRAGTCFEYQAFDPVAVESLPVRMRPLIVMEGSILDTKYMNLGTGDAALSYIRTLMEHCRKVGGVFTLLWHNSSFRAKAEKHMYKTILEAFK